MAKLTLEQLRKLREEARRKAAERGAAGAPIRAIVGVGTCGVAAGAEETIKAITAAAAEAGLADKVEIKRTGCMGLCYVEPTVEIVMEGMPRVIYGKMTADVAKDLVRKHFVERRLLENHIYDRPAADVAAR